MSNEYPGLPFRWLLPAAQLIVCFFAMWPYRLELIGWLILASRAHTPPQAVVEQPRAKVQAPPDVNVDLKPMTEAEARVYHQKEQIRWLPTALNIPSQLVQMPYAIWGPTHEDWSPRGMSRDAWETLTAPVLGILFWWIAGRSIEAILAARQGGLIPAITWIETLVGVLTLLLGALVCAAFLTERDADAVRPWQVMSIGGAIWTLLGLTTITARIAQWRIRRQNRLSKNSPANALE
jgi:hypothetical protein